MKMRITVNGQAYHVEVEVLDDSTPMATAAPAATGASGAAALAAPAAAAAASTGEEVKSPIAGNVLSLRVKVGDTVKVNDTLLVLEAMKMESNVASPVAGTVSEVLVKEGDSVQAAQVLVKL